MATTRTLLERLNEPDETVERRMVAELDTLLNRPERQTAAAGEMLFRQNDALDGIIILLDGQVTLYKLINDQEVVFHSQTAGRVLGLLALTRLARAFFNCRTVTPVTYLRIPVDQLDTALQQSEGLQQAFQTVLMRSMARRSTRLVELQSEVLALNKNLARERDALAQTLRELQQAQSLLVESEKMATLGHLAAGVAHELNNPIAAINRSAAFLQSDLLALTAELPDGGVFSEMLQRALTRKPLASREQRARRQVLAEALGDDTWAEKVVEAGIEDPADYNRLVGQWTGPRAERVAQLGRYYQLGSALRNIDSCSNRIAGLVKSLRAYSRADQAEAGPVDIHEGLEDTLRLFSSRLRSVTVEKQFGSLPPVHGYAGELNQIWTNLIANALDAMQDAGKLTLTTLMHGTEVEIQVQDSGPGISPAHQARIFDVHFSTRQGRMEFGLGLGLSIVRNIVSRHGGRIEVASKPGCTVFSVCLPAAHQHSISTRNQEK